MRSSRVSHRVSEHQRHVVRVNCVRVVLLQAATRGKHAKRPDQMLPQRQQRFLKHPAVKLANESKMQDSSSHQMKHPSIT